MNFNFTGKNITISDSMKDKIISKISRLEKLLPDDVVIHVFCSQTKNENTVEVTIPLKKRILRAEVESKDMYSAIDSIVDILDKQMIKYKERLKSKSRRDHHFNDEFKYISGGSDHHEENEIVIERVKHFELKPMDAEEAVMEMELLGHSFYAFRNGHTDAVNVVYKRKNGTYGLIEPE